jgi:hypothetical protein
METAASISSAHVLRVRLPSLYSDDIVEIAQITGEIDKIKKEKEKEGKEKERELKERMTQVLRKYNCNLEELMGIEFAGKWDAFLGVSELKSFFK